MLANSFMLHKGAEKTSIDDVYHAETPQRTDTYVPIPHFRYQQLIKDNLERQGYRVDDQFHAMTKNKERYFGAFEVMPPSWLDKESNFIAPVSDDQNLVAKSVHQALIVGFRNGHGGLMSAGLAIGLRMFICDNLAFSGDITVTRKHTGQILKDLPDLVVNGLAKIPSSTTKMIARYDTYKGTTCDEWLADHVIMECLRNSIISSQQVKQVLKSFNRPQRAWAENSDTLWNLFNAFTWNLKPKSPQKILELPKRTLKLHDVFDQYAEGGKTGDEANKGWANDVREVIDVPLANEVA